MAFGASLALTSSLTAQSVEVPTVLTAGTAVTIGYVNPGMAGQTVLIDVDNGMRRNTQTAVIEITLDANGRGTVSWQVPSWLGANFNAPEAAEQHAPIV